MTMLIDCHVLTMQGDNAAWRDELRRDLDAEPVRQHWLPGIAGELGRARAAGLEAGVSPKTWARVAAISDSAPGWSVMTLAEGAACSRASAAATSTRAGAI